MDRNRPLSSVTINILFLLLFLFIPAICLQAQKEPVTVDQNATRKTRALFLNLRSLSGKGILVGHQDDLAYGVSWKDEPERSDIRDVTGEYPALFGWDISKLGQREFNIDSVDFEKMKHWIREGFRMGGVITISWHMDNPVTGGDSWDKTPAVYSILPGGDNHETYKQKLDLLAVFLKDLKVGLWTKVPVIFRPFHEHTGNWFWWGRGNTSAEEYKRLWKFTVEYLRDEKNIHQLLYAYSTDVFDSEEDYLEFYPGDEYVDIMAYDDYRNIRRAEDREDYVQRLETLSRIAQERNKVAALSETGLEKIPLDDWYTGVLLKGFKENEATRNIAYVMLWRNANPGHHYAPFKGHSSEQDFIEFYNDPFTLFIDDLPDMYKLP